MTATIRDVRGETIARYFAAVAGTPLVAAGNFRPGRIRPALTDQILAFVDVIAAAEPEAQIFGGSFTGQLHQPRIRVSVLGPEPGQLTPTFLAAKQILETLHNNPDRTQWTEIAALDGEPIEEFNEDVGERPVYRVDFRIRYREA